MKVRQTRPVNRHKIRIYVPVYVVLDQQVKEIIAHFHLISI